MSLYTALLASSLARMYPVDKANHYMRGTWVATLASNLSLIAYAIGLAVIVHRFGRAPWNLSLLLLLALGLLVAAAVGALCAYVVGKWKEAMDQQANDAARADWLETDQSTPFVPPHGVEVADWQFTAWGAAPVSITLLVAAAALAAIEMT